jgi:hypothetical protein
MLPYEPGCVITVPPYDAEAIGGITPFASRATSESGGRQSAKQPGGRVVI